MTKRQCFARRIASRQIGSLGFRNSFVIRNWSFVIANERSFHFSEINKPNRYTENSKGHRQRSPKPPVFAENSKINQDHAQSVKTVEQKEKQERDVDAGVEMDSFSRSPILRIRNHVTRCPSGVNFYWNQQEQTDRADALRNPRPRSAIILKTFSCSMLDVRRWMFDVLRFHSR